MKLHIGCGEKYLPGYRHMDIRKCGSHIDYIGSVDDLHMFEDESIEEMYACHILEHFDRNVVDDVLSEWYRVIKIGGVLRIAVPDFEAVVAEYSENHELEKVYGLLYGGQNYEYNYHYGVYDFDYLSKKLKKVGFSSVKRYDWRTFIPEGYDDYSRAYLPHMDFEHGRLMSLNVIAIK